MTTLLGNCRSLENVFYAPEEGIPIRYSTTPAGYRQIAQILGRSKDTLRYLGLNMGRQSWLFPRNYDVENIQKFPRLTYISANGKSYQKRDSEPFDRVFVKDTGNVVKRTLDFQFALDQEIGF